MLLIADKIKVNQLDAMFPVNTSSFKRNSDTI